MNENFQSMRECASDGHSEVNDLSNGHFSKRPLEERKHQSVAYCLLDSISVLRAGD